MTLSPVTSADVLALLEFLSVADLTLSGLDSPAVHLWIDRDDTGAIVGSTGFELSMSGTDALIRSVAVSPSLRGQGRGLELAIFALDAAASAGAQMAWLFSRRSGPFWQKLGFELADRHALATALSSTQQVQLFRETGQLDREVAWSRAL